MSGRNPDFLVIGAMKAGSTSLHEQLSRHPDLYLHPRKEPGFFSRDERYARGIDWYRSLFADARPDQLCGESSTCYTRWPHFPEVAPRILEHAAETRFVYIMRDPVERAYSHYSHLMGERRSEGLPVIPFGEAIEAIPEIVDTSLYCVQIERFLAHFSRDRFLFLTLEELAAQPAQQLEEIQRFLGVRVVDLTGGGAVRANRSGLALARRRQYERFDRLRRAPMLRRVIEVVPQPLRARVREAALHPRVAAALGRGAMRRLESDRSPLDPASRARLSARFEQPDRQLAALLGRPLPWCR